MTAVELFSALSPPPPPPLPPQSQGILPPTYGPGKLTVNTIQLCHGKSDFSNEGGPKERIRYLIGTQKVWRNIEEEERESCLWLIHDSPVLPIIQDGPTCGLVVVLMAAEMLNKEPCAIEYILGVAQEKGLTLQGEMFCADEMLQLSKSIFKCDGRVLLNGLDAARHEVLSHLHKSLPILIPYDADANHAPTCRGGHRSHWAILTGYAVFFKNAEKNPKYKNNIDLYDQDELVSSIFHQRNAPFNENLAKDAFKSEEAEIFLFARQGKSRHLGLWSWDDLARSNANLKEFRPDKKSEEFIIPIGGVKEGLCSKFVLLHN